MKISIMLFLFFIISSLLCIGVDCLPPPPYLKPCSLKDNFQKCAMRTAEVFIPKFVNGDKQYGIPIIDPFKMRILTITPGDRFKLNLTDVTISGLKDAKLSDLKYEPTTRHLILFVDIPSIVLTSKYEVDGKLMVLPISGSGDFKFSVNQVKAKFEVDIVPLEKDGEVYAIMNNDHLDLKLKNAKVNFDKLFNGDPLLGSEVNKFINENWDEVYKDLDAGIKTPLSTVCRLVLENYFARIPLKDLILE